MILYLPVRQNLFHSDIGEYLSYGIAAVKPFGSWRQVAFVADVDTSVHRMLLLAFRCTYCQLDPIHLIDVVEDFLCN